MINLIKKNSFDEVATEICNFINSNQLHKIIGLSGGSTIPPILQACNKHIFTSEKNHWTWIDERLVPYEDEGSNYGSVKSYLIDEHCFPLPNEDSYEAKNTYQTKLATINGLPQLDLLLLGFGNDGHIASLFPNSEQLNKECNEDNWLFRSEASYEPKQRWTWGMGALLKSKQTFIIFKGDDNSEKFQRFKEANNNPNCNTPLAEFIKRNKEAIQAFQVL